MPAAYATDADLTGRITDAAAVDSAVRALALADAAERIDSRNFGVLLLQAHVYLTAHLIACRTGALGGASPAGAVTSMSAGSISIGMSAPAAENNYSATKWGQEYQTLAQGRYNVEAV